MIGDGLVDDQIVARRVLLLKAGLEENLDEGQGAAIAHRGFVAVDLADDVVDLESADRGQNMFDGMDLDLADADGRAAGDIDDVIDVGRDDRTVGHVNAAEEDAGVGRSRNEGNSGFIAGMKTHAGVGDGVLNRALVLDHSSSRVPRSGISAVHPYLHSACG